MDYEFTEKPKNKPLNSPYRNMFYMVVGICIVCVWMGWSVLQNFAPSDKHMSSPEFVATETATLLEAHPELADWERYSDREIAIWLPRTYQSYKLEDFVGLIEDGITDVPSELQPFMDILVNNPDMMRFVSYDVNTLSGYPNGVNIIREQAPQMSMDRYMDISIDNLPSTAIMAQQPVDITVGDYKAKFFVLNYGGFGYDFTAIDYIISKNGYFYTFTFATLTDDSDEMITMSQKAMSTLRIYTHLQARNE